MKNKEITMYELIGLMKDGREPMVVYYGGTEYCRTDGNYRHEYLTDEVDEDWELFTSLDKDFLNDKVEIIEENDEWEDIEDLGMVYSNNVEEEIMRNRYIIRQLIKNQKYLKERLDKDE